MSYPHQLDPIKRKHIYEAAKQIYNMSEFPKDHDWNEYYVVVKNWKYPFKQLTRVAYKMATGEDLSDKFQSNETNRGKIKSLGFNIHHVEGGISYKEVNKAAKIVRIVWNIYNWTKPSGPEGKSSGDNYEGRNKFGHEEWLFDDKMVIDGFKYGFLEPIHKFRDKYKKKFFDISLYTYNGDAKKFYWIKTLKNVEVISLERSEEILAIYQKKGWLNSMKEDLEAVGISEGKINKWKKEQALLFNIKFDASQLGPIELIEIEDDITSYRYQLMDADKQIVEKYTQREKSGFDYDESGSTDSSCKTNKSTRKYSPRECEIEMIHNELQQKFHEYLQKIYGKNCIKRECTTYGRRIDLTLRAKDETVFYEIKTYSNPITSIREALGQLLEYCFYYGVCNADKIIIVTHKELNNEGKIYFMDLQKIIKLPLFYICFDMKKNRIIQEL